MEECPKLIPADPLQTKGKQRPHKSHKTLCAIFIPGKKAVPRHGGRGTSVRRKRNDHEPDPGRINRSWRESAPDLRRRLRRFPIW